MRRLVEKSAGTESSSTPAATASGGTVHVEVDGHVHGLSREDAECLREELADALTQRREFLNTACEHRLDGRYVVERRGADSAGHRKVFESFDAAQRLFDRLPDEFTADDLSSTGLTGGRRHMVLWHFVEHPDFACSLSSRQPLTATKGGET